jgi:ABC-type Zn uptake system ZnuABC Zn-binding protein ZnuA
MKKIGIWIDKEKAHIVTLEGEKEYFKTIVSELESFNVRGGSRSKTRWGPQQVVHDSKYLEREKHQMRDYFAKLAEAVKSADVISIFGPAEVKEKFAKELSEKHPGIDAKVKAVETADSMTDNQVKAMIKEHFGWERP